jgi:hypothetical protein
MAFAKPTASAWFKPAEHMNDLCILVEAKEVKYNQKSVFEGVEQIRDIAVADLAFFKTSADIDNAEPSEVIKGANITNLVLVKDIDERGYIGDSIPLVVRKSGRSYVWRKTEYPGADEAAEKYYNKREAETQSNLDDFPLD